MQDASKGDGQIYVIIWRYVTPMGLADRAAKRLWLHLQSEGRNPLKSP